MTVVAALAKPTYASEYRILVTAVPGSSSYTTGGFAVTVPLRKVEFALVGSAGGYVAAISSISGNTVTIQVFQSNSVVGTLVEVAAGTNLSSVTFPLVVVGY